MSCLSNVFIKMADKKPSPVKNFLIGGAAGMFATCVIQPIDYVKVAIQIRGSSGGSTNPIIVAKEIIAEEGFVHLYKGIDAALTRQATYTTTRMGVFKTLTDRHSQNNEGPIPFVLRSVYSLLAGGVGAMVGNPADLSLIRMQADSTLPEEQKRNYKGIGNAISRIVKEEGFTALWRGATPTVVRAMALNFGMLGTYDQFKDMLSNLTGGSGKLVNVTASFCAASVACIVTLPFDNVKTKFQRMVADKDGKLPYKGFGDCFKKSIQTEGVKGLYVGLPTFVIRIAPHVVITLLFVDTAHYLLSKK